jgi:hypothetical protein
MRLMHCGIAAGLAFLLSGCAAVVAEGIAVDAVAATAEGTLAADAAAGGELAAARAAGGAAMADSALAVDATGGGLAGAPMARLLVSDPMLQFAEEGGALRIGLQRLTANGTRTAVLGVDASGVIRAGLEPIAEFRGRSLFYDNQRVGELEGNVLFDVRDGARSAVAELDGVLPGRILAPRYRGLLGASEVFVEVTQVSDGFYTIRLSGQEFRVPAAFVSLALLGTQLGTCSDERGAVVRRSGAIVRYERCREDRDVYYLQTADGEMALDKDQVRKFIPGLLTTNAVAPALELKGGYAVFGRTQNVRDAYEVSTPAGMMLIDKERVANAAGA